MGPAKKILSAIDVGGWAAHYADNTFGYGHFKEEVYALFSDILHAVIPGRGRVLDIGAGPANLTYEYRRRHPPHNLQWTLVDASAELLKIGRARFRSRARKPRTIVRSYNMNGWDRGLGTFDALVSNNSIFNLKPARLDRFYRECFRLLRPGGIFLNQQSFAFEGDVSPYGTHSFAKFVKTHLPETIMPPNAGCLSARRKAAAKRRTEMAAAEWREALRKAEAEGVKIARGQSGYWFLTAEAHLESLRKAGFLAGCIWRKREFAVLLGIKESRK